MDTMRLLEIGIDLGKLYQERAQANLDAWRSGKDIEARQLELTPDDGWPGKNAEQRDAAAKKAFASDEALQALLVGQEDTQTEALLLEGDIQALEAERRALEWTIRSRQVELLDLNAIQSNHNGDRAATAFDDVADQVMEHGISDHIGQDFIPPAEEPVEWTLDF